MKDIYWYGMYKDSYDLISPDSYAHPAKMSPRLCFKIIEHLEEMGLLKPGDTILDPMAGTGLTAICAGAKGYKAVTVELEEKFINFQKQNKEYAERKLYKELDWTILQGDSRYLSQLLNDKYVSVMSPPYENTEIAVNANKTDIPLRKKLRAENNWQGYGQTPGQIGNLKDKPIVITSPPYQDSIKGIPGIDWTKIDNGKRDMTKEDWNNIRIQGMSGYSSNPANLGNLPDKPLVTVTSPPYAGDVGHHGRDEDGIRKEKGLRGDYGKSQGQIGDLFDKPLVTVTSPPYEDMHVRQYDESVGKAWKEGNRSYHDNDTYLYHKADGESYLSAMKQVYSEILKVSNVLVVVLKNPTRNKKLRRLDLDTIEILKQVGWKIHCQHRSLLFEEIEHPTLFGDTHKKIKGRMSFFKRLSYQNGQPVASWEDVIFAVRNKGNE